MKKLGKKIYSMRIGCAVWTLRNDKRYEFTYKQIGELFGLSATRVYQIEAKFMESVRQLDKEV